ncbi:MAG: plastocyanin/azurin family copper-binding protein [Thermoproteota archaeon]|nr:plastocyanin/azurin family copper-binding protein [Candidatus Nitrosotenuis sp.]
MTAADKFGIAFSIGITVALIAFAMSFSATSKAPTAPMPVPTTPTTPPAPAPTPTPPAPQPPVMEEEPVVEEEPPMEEAPVMEEEPVVEEEPEVAMSAEVSIPSGASVPGCEETNECFIPSTVTIGVGGTVTWSNDDTAAHTVTSGSAETGPDGTFDSSIFMAGKTFEHTFDQAGEYDYFCIVHPWMTGKVIVE